MAKEEAKTKRLKYNITYLKRKDIRRIREVLNAINPKGFRINYYNEEEELIITDIETIKVFKAFGKLLGRNDINIK